MMLNAKLAFFNTLHFLRHSVEATSCITHSQQLIVVLVSLDAPKIGLMSTHRQEYPFPTYSNVTGLTVIIYGRREV
jgi:hypothetical protein